MAVGHRYGETAAIEEQMQRDIAHRQSQRTWQEICLEGMRREQVRLANELENARRAAETIPQLEALITMQKAKIEKFTQEHAA
ncbi:MAG TPA: hypothetical protein VLH56_18315 [Dissulfurispiraceae bacterium]|nr:hypothetical protein [Dissulfurispiraceae bacterium]